MENKLYIEETRCLVIEFRDNRIGVSGKFEIFNPTSDEINHAFDLIHHKRLDDWKYRDIEICQEEILSVEINNGIENTNG